MVDIRENYKFDLGVKGLMLLTFLLSFLSLVFDRTLLIMGFTWFRTAFWVTSWAYATVSGLAIA